MSVLLRNLICCHTNSVKHRSSLPRMIVSKIILTSSFSIYFKLKLYSHLLHTHGPPLVHFHPPDHLPQPPVALQEVAGIAPITVKLRNLLPSDGGRHLPLLHRGLGGSPSHCNNFHRQPIILVLGILPWLYQYSQVLGWWKVVWWQVKMFVSQGWFRQTSCVVGGVLDWPDQVLVLDNILGDV